MPMSMIALRALRHSALLLLGLAPFAASAAPWRYLEPQPSIPYEPSRFAAATDDVVWSFDGASIRRSQSDGSSTTLYRNELVYATRFVEGFATADGGLIAHDGRCGLQRIGPDQRAIWRVRLDFYACHGVRVAADGTTWIGATSAGDGDYLHQIGANGETLARRRAGSNELSLFAFHRLIDFAALDGGGEVELTHGVANYDAAVTRRGDRAQILWSTDISGARDRAQRLVAGADGSADVLGTTGNNLWVTRINAQGQITQTRQLVMVTPGSVLAARRAADGAVYVVIGSRSTVGDLPLRLLRVGADGALTWDQHYCATAQFVEPRVEFAVSGDTVANLCSGDGVEMLVRRAADGGARTQVLPFDRALQVAAGDDGEWRVLGRENAQAPYRTRLIALGAGETIRDLSLGAADEREALRLHAAAIDLDGNSYLLSQHDAAQGEPTTQTLTRLASDGTVLWRKTSPGLKIHTAQLTARHGLVCASVLASTGPFSGSAAKYSAFCLRDIDGSAFGSTFNAPTDTVLRNEITPIRGNRAIIVTATDTEYSVMLVDGTTRTTTLSGSGRLHNSGVDDDGRSTLAVEQRVVRIDASGRQLYQVDVSPIGTYDAPFASTADGRVYTSGTVRGAIGTSVRMLWALDANGATRWQANVLTETRAAQIVPTGDAIYVHAFNGGVNGVSTNFTSKHSDSDGQRLWRHQSVDRTESNQTARGAQIALSTDQSDVVLLGSWGNRLRLERLNAADGRRELERFIDCNGRCDPIATFALDAAGDARTAYAAVDQQAGQTAVAQSLGDVLRDPAATRVDQPGITGLWHAPYTNGQGVSIDWLPESRTLFAAWFTYTANRDVNDPAQLRWYTLQANGIAAGTTELELPVLQTSGGVFDDGPAVSPRIVGRARLRFTDCDSASLSYEIDGSATTTSSAGTISLSRVTPATQSCVLADGSTRPGAGARPPSKGFDARLSGAWYDEATVGQGVQLNVQPDGVLFVPWFTYDPGPANDATGQHWFTLQGNLAQAVNGTVEAQLIQTIGGAFDWSPTWNANVVGTATLSVQACDRATIAYRFDTARIASPYAGRRGELSLRRMGGCAP